MFRSLIRAKLQELEFRGLILIFNKLIGHFRGLISKKKNFEGQLRLNCKSSKPKTKKQIRCTFRNLNLLN